ncbi:MAG TPA: DUF6152 family protein [Gammaproteobacteria bacterium]
MTLKSMLLAALAGFATMAAAHHSFAVYDMTTTVEFEGVVETLKFRNPHIAMTLLRKNEDGEEEKVEFVEGAPANMLVRMGLDPARIKPGTKIKAVGSPRTDNPNAYFLRTIILEDGTRFESLGNDRER